MSLTLRANQILRVCQCSLTVYTVWETSMPIWKTLGGVLNTGSKPNYWGAHLKYLLMTIGKRCGEYFKRMGANSESSLPIVQTGNRYQVRDGQCYETPAKEDLAKSGK
jgi:hypothetical protein